MSPIPLLYVEDSDADAFLTDYALDIAGIVPKPMRVSNGLAAIRYLDGIGEFADRTKYPLPCILLTDLRMPYVDGLDLLKYVRSRPMLQTLVVVMYTGSATQSTIDEAYRCGVNSFIVKPTTVDELNEVVAAMWRYWAVYNRLASFPCSAPPQSSEPDASAADI